jgi:hypothetical protein
MIKTNRSRKTKSAANPRSRAAPIRKTKPGKAAGETKHDQILALLRRAGGVSIAAIVKATGWQEHSVRGFLAGTVRKKLRLNLESKKHDGQRIIYRVITTKSSATASQPKAA